MPPRETRRDVTVRAASHDASTRTGLPAPGTARTARTVPAESPVHPHPCSSKLGRVRPVPLNCSTGSSSRATVTSEPVPVSTNAKCSAAASIAGLDGWWPSSGGIPSTFSVWPPW